MSPSSLYPSAILDDLFEMKLLLTGPPGIGKTTVIRKALTGIDLTAGGFFTQEIREHGRRVGFSLHTLNGEQGILAHVDYTGRYTVGRYGVDLTRFEAMVIPALERGLQEKELVVIDEIGKMELFSQRFCEMVRQIIEQDKKHLLGVIHQGRGGFVDVIKERKDVEVIVVTGENRDALPSQIMIRLQGERR